MQVDPYHIHSMKSNVPLSPYKQCATPPRRVKYLGPHLDRRLTSIFIKWKQLGFTFAKIYWLLERKSKLSTSAKLLIYKTILKSIWTYGIQLWGMASTSNIEILEVFQPKTLCMIVDAPWYMPNMVIWRDLQIPTVKEEICCHSSQYSVHLSAHPNDITVHLMKLPDRRRLRRYLPYDLPTRILVIVFVTLVFQYVNLIPKSHRRLWNYCLQRSATEHSSTCHCICCSHNLLDVLVQIANKKNQYIKLYIYFLATLLYTHHEY
jgi:hypothetical protein